MHGTRPLLLNRMQLRPGHFFKAEMLDSQLATLEVPLEDDEKDVVRVRLGKDDDEACEVGLRGVVEEATRAARAWVG